MLDKAIARGLNEEQSQAVAHVRGPLCILAGAGTGKTTTITRRIANQVLTGTFVPSEILAVTFTNKAAQEMVGRLNAVSVREVRCKTFHAEALSQYQRFSDEPKEILGAKGRLLATLIRSLPMPYRFTSMRDIASEIEWAKNRRLTPSTYERMLGDHEPPIPADLMARLFASYESRKASTGQIDFEDMLEETIGILERDMTALMSVRERYRAFTVDEYQDVNLLQQTLLDLWVGDRDDVCVVGDDHQSIFGFTGASASYLVGFPQRYAGCKVVTLVKNYRSTPQILATANKLVPGLGGFTKRLEPTLPEGQPPVFRAFPDAEGEVRSIVDEVRRLHRDGVAWEDMAVLHRINGRSDDLELAFSRAKVPYQVKDSVFLKRPAARDLTAKLRGQGNRPAAQVVPELVDRLGYRADEQFSGDEATRQADLARLRAMAESFEGSASAFLEDLAKRFASEDQVKGVQILTYHRAKGLEFTAVFLPRCEDREIPFVLSKTEEELSEERRLFYVGITRAKRFLHLSWCSTRATERRKSNSPSPFLQEIGWAGQRTSGGSPAGQQAGRNPTTVPSQDQQLFEALKAWRLEKSRELSVPAYVIFHDSTLAAIAAARPKAVHALAAISGIGPTKSERFGQEVLSVVAKSRSGAAAPTR